MDNGNYWTYSNEDGILGILFIVLIVIQVGMV